MIDLRDPGVDAGAVIEALELRPHPEGGHYRETWRDVPPDGGRGAGTAILFLLRDGETSRWHRVDAAELWIWQAGSPLSLRRSPGEAVTLGPDLRAGQMLQALVPAGFWQAARCSGPWSLCCCVVTPAFRFDGFEMAAAGWEPG
jgi:predicted cupin superfamily sugar epimerase